MQNTQPEELNPIPLISFDEFEEGKIGIFERALIHAERLPKDFVPSTSFSANVKSLYSPERYRPSFAEIREFMSNTALQEEN